MKQSIEMSERKAAAMAGTMGSLEDLALFVDGDDRGPVIQAAAQRSIALGAAAGPEAQPRAAVQARSGRKDPKNWKHWKYHTVRFPEDEDEPLYVDKVILGTQRNADGVEEDVTIVHRQMRGVDVPNVPTAVVRSWFDQIETRFKQRRKPGQNGGMTMVGRRVRVRDFHIVESYDEKKTAEECALISVSQEEARDNLPDLPELEESETEDLDNEAMAATTE